MRGEFVFRVHAVQRMIQRGASADDVIEVIGQADGIEDYPDDFPFPSRLLLGWVKDRPLHVVAAQDAEGTVIIIAVYDPDPARWDTSFRERMEP